jgi:hypothetical protein
MVRCVIQTDEQPLESRVVLQALHRLAAVISDKSTSLAWRIRWS